MCLGQTAEGDKKKKPETKFWKCNVGFDKLVIRLIGWMTKNTMWPGGKKHLICYLCLDLEADGNTSLPSGTRRGARTATPSCTDSLLVWSPQNVWASDYDAPWTRVSCTSNWEETQNMPPRLHIPSGTENTSRSLMRCRSVYRSQRGGFCHHDPEWHSSIFSHLVSRSYDIM